MLLSLAGIPLTGGFIAKFYVMAAGAAFSLWVLVLALVANSAIGLYYYLRVILVLYAASPEKKTEEAPRPVPGATLAVLAVVLLWLGIYPEPLLRVVKFLGG
jgi:NADH-quinone oxidoreductase subunit N